MGGVQLRAGTAGVCRLAHATHCCRQLRQVPPQRRVPRARGAGIWGTNAAIVIYVFIELCFHVSIYIYHYYHYIFIRILY